jgi:hypothetical protein
MKGFFKIMGGFIAAGITAFLLFAWASLGFWPVSTVRGWTQARFDLARGHYKVLGYGLPTQWRSDYVSILGSRYGVQFRPVTGCVVSQGTLDYVEAYDNVSVAAINRRFGRDIIKEAEDEAEKEWASAHPAGTSK